MNSLVLGVVRRPGRAVIEGLAALGALWSLVEMHAHFFQNSAIRGLCAFIAMTLASVVWAIYRVRTLSKIVLPIPQSNTRIEVVFGDLFAEDGLRVIAVNEFFDSKLGRPVSEMSLHGILLKKILGGHPDAFDRQVDAQLSNEPFVTVTRPEGKDRQFAIGSTALVHANNANYLLFALSKTDPATCKASCDVATLWDALERMWQRGRVESHGQPIVVPLVGSGLAGVGLPPRELLYLIMLSVVVATRRNQIATCIRLVLHSDQRENIDLRGVEAYWRT